MSEPPTTEQTVDAARSSYPPGWPHLLVRAMERLPGPAWVAYVALVLIIALIMHLRGWSRGDAPVGTFDLASTYWGLLGGAILWTFGYLERAAAAAFEAFRPALAPAAGDPERLRHELTTMPRIPAIVVAFVATLLTVITLVFEPASSDVDGVPGPVFVAVMVVQAFMTSVLFAFLYQLVRQARQVGLILDRWAVIDIFRPGPLNAFPRLMAMSGASVVLLVGSSVVLAEPATAGELPRVVGAICRGSAGRRGDRLHRPALRHAPAARRREGAPGGRGRGASQGTARRGRPGHRCPRAGRSRPARPRTRARAEGARDRGEAPDVAVVRRDRPRVRLGDPVAARALPGAAVPVPARLTGGELARPANKRAGIATAIAPNSAPVDVHDLDRLGEALERRAPEAGRPVRLPDRRDARHDLAGATECRDPRRLMDALAVEVAADLRRIGGMEPDPDLGREALRRALLREPPLDRDRRRHREVRRVEADEEAVAGRGDLLAALGPEHLPERRVVPAQHRLPGLIAERLDETRRADDVGEHERLHDPPGGTCLAAQLPRQELRGVLEDDRGGRTGERCGAEDLLVDAVGADDVGLAVVARQPVEGRRGEGDAVARTDALVAVDTRPDGHQWDPTAASPRNASEVASARLEVPSRASSRARRWTTSSSPRSSSAAISAFVRPSVRSCSSRRSVSSRVGPAGAADPAAAASGAGTSMGPTSATSSRPTGPVSQRTRIFSSAVPWAILDRVC